MMQTPPFLWRGLFVRFWPLAVVDWLGGPGRWRQVRFRPKAAITLQQIQPKAFVVGQSALRGC
jgi:hypothetical protein